MKAIDIRSESAVKLIAEFLDMDAPCTEDARRVNAEHFAHGKSYSLWPKPSA
jgi:E3 ubiquitin-protein ligase Topors